MRSGRTSAAGEPAGVVDSGEPMELAASVTGRFPSPGAGRGAQVSPISVELSTAAGGWASGAGVTVAGIEGETRSMLSRGSAARKRLGAASWVISPTRRSARIREIELAFGPRHGDIGQALLFREAARLLEHPRMGQDPFLKPAQEHDGKFQALDGVDRPPA